MIALGQDRVTATPRGLFMLSIVLLVKNTGEKPGFFFQRTPRIHFTEKGAARF